MAKTIQYHWEVVSSRSKVMTIKGRKFPWASVQILTNGQYLAFVTTRSQTFRKQFAKHSEATEWAVRTAQEQL